jgi:hypothetical protein
MQNELADNTMLGSKYREEKYAKMGAEPLKDMLMSMRFRSKLDEKFMPRQSKKANELENTITSVADSSEDGVAELGNILRDASYGMLSEKL